jgi:hypothetical protein
LRFQQLLKDLDVADGGSAAAIEFRPRLCTWRAAGMLGRSLRGTGPWRRDDRLLFTRRARDRAIPHVDREGALESFTTTARSIVRPIASVRLGADRYLLLRGAIPRADRRTPPAVDIVARGLQHARPAVDIVARGLQHARSSASGFAAPLVASAGTCDATVAR